jgi:hypothetical protein
MSTPSMKFRASLFAAVLAVLPLSLASHAQTNKAVGRFNVPFAFETGSRHFAAGRYTIRMEKPNIISIQGASGFAFAMMQQDEARQPANTTKLVFRRYGGRYVLSQVWTIGETGYLRHVPTKAEKQLQLASNATAPKGVEVAIMETPR